MPQPINRRLLNVLRTVGILEGLSTVSLFGIAMPLKYLADQPLAVTIVGSIHGLLFLALLALALVAKSGVPLSTRLTVAVVVGAVIPFGPFVVEIWLGRLARSAADGGELDRSQPLADR